MKKVGAQPWGMGRYIYISLKCTHEKYGCGHAHNTRAGIFAETPTMGKPMGHNMDTCEVLGVSFEVTCSEG